MELCLNLKQEQVELSWSHVGAPGAPQGQILYTLNPFILLQPLKKYIIILIINVFSWKAEYIY